ncbi:hypothetical protein OIDMADRAFT_56981 [Oidiodendron maius Zn]|uniref:Uncharacterized protein n=1 Tax=Oidiodendron maius (strain Zn) TaxID=913774 RepID=A0A0C3H5S5_OIDMZ|nr:hypothetical protein OIDMADRAFT_56981 [Oidiodendron maius Zn]
MSFKFILDDIFQKQKRDLAATKVRTLDFVQDDQTFDTAFDSLLHKSADRTDSKQKLKPSIEKTKAFSSALQSTTCDGAYATLLWRAFFAALESGFQSAELRENTVDQVMALDLAMPYFERPISIYNSDNVRLRLALADLYDDYLKFYVKLIRITSEDRGSKFRSKYAFSKEAKKTLQDIEECASIHGQNFEEQVKTIQVRLLEQEIAAKQNALKHVPTMSIEGVQTPASNPSVAESIVEHRSRVNLRHMVNIVRRNNEFFGRNDEFSQIHQYLEGSSTQSNASATSFNDSEPDICIIHGIGGVGKTQTALEYAYKYRSLYDWVFWVRAESSAEILKSYSSIGKKLGLFGSTSIIDQNTLEKIQEWFETTDKRWLLVFDNVETWDDIIVYWPSSTDSSSSIIITTQKPADVLPWSNNIVQLLPFDKPAGSSLLLTRFKGDESTEEEKDLASEITHIVGGLPLYLNQATGFMKISQCSLAEYLAMLQKSSSIPENSTADKNLGYDKPLNAAFDVALTKLSDNARNLLYILAFLNPEAVPESMIFSDHSDNDLAFLRFDENKFSMVAQLRDSQLVRRETINGDVCLATHRSLQRAILHKLNNETSQRQKSFDIVLKLLQAVLPKPSALQQPEEGTWPIIEKYLPQIQSLEAAYNRAKPKIAGSFELAEIFSQFGVDLYDRGLIKVGEKLMKSAEDILDSIAFDNSSPVRTNIHIVIGMYTDTLGITRRDEGLERRIKALDLRKQALKGRAPADIRTEEDILLHNAVMDLSCSYQQFNRFDKVEELSNICFEKFKTWGRPEAFPYEYAKYYHSMAFVFVYRRQTNLAVEFAKAAADLMRKAGPGTLLTTVYRFDWAIFLFQDQKVKQAIKEHEEVLDIRLARCGKSNPLTLQSYLTLGIMNYFDHNFEIAEDWIRKVLIHHQKVYWPRENVARAKYYFSLILQATPSARSLEPSNISLSSTYSGSAHLRGARDEVSHEELVEVFRNEAKVVLDELLPHNRSEMLSGKPDGEAVEAVLYDYMAPWGYRVVVQQVPDYLKALVMYQESKL